MEDKKLTSEQDSFIEMHYRGMRKKLLNYATSQLHNESISEEAVHETFRIACSKADTFHSSSNPEGWLMKTLVFTIRNIQRCNQTISKYLIPLSDIEGIDGPPDSYITDLEARFGKLAKTEDFQILTSIVLEKNSMAEVARKYGISVEACKKRMQRIKKKLQKELDDDS